MNTDFFKVILRRLRLIKLNRDFLVFLLFLLVSIIFWFMQSIKETAEVVIPYKLEIEDQPKNVIFTGEIPSEVNVSYTGKGWDALYYKFMKNEPHELVINFKEVNTKTGRIIIDSNALRRAVLKKKPQGLTFRATSPNKIEAFYSNGQHKRVPVIFNGRVTTTAGRYQCGTLLTPDSVDIYAPNHLFGSIKSVKTENVTYNELEDTLQTKLALLVPRGAKAIPDSIETQICVDIFTDKTLQVPIYSENVPSNKVLRTFPLKTKVTFLISATLYNEITADDFLLAVDYKEVTTNSNRCQVHVRQQPKNIRNLRINPEYVEFIIEKVTE